MSKKDRPPRTAPGVQQMAAHPGPTVGADGRTYRLGFCDQNAKGRLEELVSAHVWARVYAESGRMPPGLAEKHVARYDALFETGHYATFGKGWQATIGSPDGAVLFLLSLLQAHHPDMTPDEARGVFAANPGGCRRAIGVIAPDFFAAVLRQLGMPEDRIAAQMPAVLKTVAELADAPGTPAPATAGG